MPTATAIPTNEEITQWRARWTPERINDIVRVLQKDPKLGCGNIVTLDWYKTENGFERWVKEEKNHGLISPGEAIVDLRGCNLHGGLSLINVNLKFARLAGARFSGVDLTGGNFYGADFTFATISYSNFTNAVCMRADFTRSKVENTDFANAALYSAILRYCEINYSTFKEARLLDATIEFSSLKRNNFRNSYFGETKLRGSNLQGSIFLGAELSGTKFLGCNFGGVDLSSISDCALVSENTIIGDDFGSSNAKSWLLTRESTELSPITPFEAMGICSEIRLCFQKNGLYHKAAAFYEQEEYWRTRNEWEMIGRWRGCVESGCRIRSLKLLSRWLLAERFMGYGERPSRIIGWSIGLILLWTLLFFWLGYEIENAPGQFTSLSSRSFGFGEGAAWLDLARCLRFSIESFTTLGFSMMRPAPGWSHTLASIEGLLGVLFVALATVTWARKAIRD